MNAFPQTRSKKKTRLTRRIHIYILITGSDTGIAHVNEISIPSIQMLSRRR